MFDIFTTKFKSLGLSSTQNITLKAGRSHRSVIQSDIKLKADNNLTITAPAGSQLIQSQGNITVKGSGFGNLTLTRRLHYIGLGFED